MNSRIRVIAIAALAAGSLFVMTPPFALAQESGQTASEGETTSDDGDERGIFERMFPPKDARFRPPGPWRQPFTPEWRQGGDGQYLIEPDRNNLKNETVVRIRVCVGETAIVPLDGSIDDNSLLPATSDTEGVKGSLERSGGKLVLKITPGKPGNHDVTLKNSDKGRVHGLRIELTAIDCDKPAKTGETPKVSDLAGKATGQTQENEAAEPGKSGISGLGASASGQSEDEKPEKPSTPTEPDAPPKRGVSGAIADAADEAARKARGDAPAGDARPEDSSAAEEPPKKTGIGEGLKKGAGAMHGSIALDNWSTGLRSQLPAEASIVSFTTVDEEGDEPDIQGSTRISLSSLGVSEEERGQVIVNFIATDRSLKTHEETTCEVLMDEKGELVVDVPDDEKYGGMLIQAGERLIAILADRPRVSTTPGASRPVAIADGSLDVALGSVSDETISGPADMANPARSVGDHSVSIGTQDVTPVAVRDGEIAIVGEELIVPPDGEMDIEVTTPSGETYVGEADAWSYDVYVPEVTPRRTAVDVALVFNGVDSDEAVAITFYPQPGQEISPRSITLQGVQNGAELSVAQLTTQKLGAQAFGVEIHRLEAENPSGEE